MSRIIVEFGGRYMDWTTNADGPISPLLTLPELRRHLLEEYGYKDLAELPSRLERVHHFGTSSHAGLTKKDILGNNHAGPERTCVTSEEEMVRLFGPGGEMPGFHQPELLDLDQPLVLKDPYWAKNPFTGRVTRIIAVDGEVVFAQLTVPDVEGTFPLLFDRSGKVLSKNFAELAVQNESA